ncbi:tetratricopeptide repeat protein [Pseudomonas sp. P3C3]
MQLVLPDELHNRIQALSAEGDSLAESTTYEKAIEKYNEAWSLLPDPKNEWEASTWLLAAIGDACFFSGYYTSGIEALQYSLTCPGGADNPFIFLRLGQCQFEKNEYAAATENLCSAYMLQGKEIFASESPKYFEFLKTRIQSPASGEW